MQLFSHPVLGRSLSSRSLTGGCSGFQSIGTHRPGPVCPSAGRCVADPRLANVVGSSLFFFLFCFVLRDVAETDHLSRTAPASMCLPGTAIIAAN